MRLTRNSSCKECFTGSGRAYEKCSFGKSRTYLCILSGIMKEINNFNERFFCFILSGYIRESNSRLFLDINFCIVFSDAERTAASAHPAHKEQHYDCDQNYRNNNAHKYLCEHSRIAAHNSLSENIMFYKLRGESLKRFHHISLIYSLILKLQGICILLEHISAGYITCLGGVNRIELKSNRHKCLFGIDLYRLNPVGIQIL